MTPALTTAPAAVVRTALPSGEAAWTESVTVGEALPTNVLWPRTVIRVVAVTPSPMLTAAPATVNPPEIVPPLKLKVPPYCSTQLLASIWSVPATWVNDAGDAPAWSGRPTFAPT